MVFLKTQIGKVVGNQKLKFPPSKKNVGYLRVLNLAQSLGSRENNDLKRDKIGRMRVMRRGSERR